MTLRRFGQSISELRHVQTTTEDNHNALIKEMKKLNDYMALMTDEPEPPTEMDENL